MTRSKVGEVSQQVIALETNGWVPNNRRLPVLIYLNAIVGGRIDLAPRVEEIFRANGWLRQWRDKVYGYHHYYTETHEVLGIALFATLVTYQKYPWTAEHAESLGNKKHKSGF